MCPFKMHVPWPHPEILIWGGWGQGICILCSTYPSPKCSGRWCACRRPFSEKHWPGVFPAPYSALWGHLIAQCLRSKVLHPPSLGSRTSSSTHQLRPRGSYLTALCPVFPPRSRDDDSASLIGSSQGTPSLHKQSTWESALTR